ncbi:DUF3072 domain-containing protein [Paraflavisolibacter sp. H34]|uniref:DUF3072 domain-containing protein n=1 Tax=Huijunlia imazamoxiresistens TaxID=3127457 RepID=UPI00301928A0
MKTRNNPDNNRSASRKGNNSRKAQDSQQQTAARSNPVKDPDEWTTGDEPMTGPQQSYLHTLAQEAGEQPDDQLSKAEASKKIEELQQKTGRGREDNGQ